MALYLVTGGAGFIGSHLVEELIRRSEQVRVVDNFSTGRRENLGQLTTQIDLIEGDIRDLDLLRNAMRGVDFVLHQAAIVSVPQSMADPMTTHQVNVNGTLNVLIAARDAKVKRVVLASSCSVYGDNDDLPLKETYPPRPLSPYAASKLAGEIYGQTFFAAYGLPTVGLRYFNVFGQRQNPNGDYAAVIPKFVTRLLAKQAPLIYGDGKQTRDFVHVSDIVRANLLACERDAAAGQIFNVASGKQTSLLELIDVLNRLMGLQLAPEIKPARAGDIRHSVGSSDKIAQRIGFHVATPLVSGLSQMIA